MNYYLSIPLLFLRFWFYDAPIALIKYLMSVNSALVQLMSLSMLFHTFFRPLKNEYRKGLVAFSIVFGIILKSALIFVDLIMLLFVVFVEILLIILFEAWPFITFYILFI